MWDSLFLNSYNYLSRLKRGLNCKNCDSAWLNYLNPRKRLPVFLVVSKPSRSLLTYKKFYVLSILLLVIGLVSGKSVDDSVCSKHLFTTSIPFNGIAKGGELILAETLNRNMRTAVIQTEPNEPAESVANRLADYFNTNDPFEWGFQKGSKVVIAQNGVLKCLLGSYIIAGTETGLGIPSSPSSLTCILAQEGNKLVLNWQNPPDVYDSIRIVLNWSNFDHRGGAKLPGDATNYVIDLDTNPVNINDLDICLFGYRNGTPSNAAALHVSGNAQKELFGIPFTNGIAPNWTAWSLGDSPETIQYRQWTRGSYTAAKGNKFNAIVHGESKPYYQVIRTTSPNIKGGVLRKFKGLIPGHTYRVSVRLSTLGMDYAKKGWSFSLHAAYNNPDGSDLTAKQLAGLSPLPNSSRGAKAGRIALYNPGVTTKANFIERSTNKPGNGQEIGDITLPAGVDTLTVWVRHHGLDSSGVSVESIRLEDISAGND